MVGKMPPTVKPAPVDPRPPLEGPGSAKKEGKEERMEKDTPPSKTKKQM
jgi:hypothetical protein